MPPNTGKATAARSFFTPEQLAEFRHMSTMYGTAFKRLGEAARMSATQISNLAKACTRMYEILIGVPQCPAKVLSPFERTLLDMERDRCTRINELQNRLLDVRY